MKIQWPFVIRSVYEKLQTENWSLRDSLREANAELRKHRALIAGLKTGQPEMTAAVERAINQ